MRRFLFAFSGLMVVLIGFSCTSAQAAERENYIARLPNKGVMSIIVYNGGTRANVDAMSITCNGQRAIMEGDGADVINGSFSLTVDGVLGGTASLTGTITPAAITGVLNAPGCDGDGPFTAPNVRAGAAAPSPSPAPEPTPAPAAPVVTQPSPTPTSPTKTWNAPNRRCSFLHRCTDKYWTTHKCFNGTEDCAPVACRHARRTGVLWHNVLEDTARTIPVLPSTFDFALDHAIMTVASSSYLQESYNVQMYCSNASYAAYRQSVKVKPYYILDLDLPLTKMFGKRLPKNIKKRLQRIEDTKDTVEDLMGVAADMSGDPALEQRPLVGPKVDGWRPYLNMTNDDLKMTFKQAK